MQNIAKPLWPRLEAYLAAANEWAEEQGAVSLEETVVMRVVMTSSRLESLASWKFARAYCGLE